MCGAWGVGVLRCAPVTVTPRELHATLTARHRAQRELAQERRDRAVSLARSRCAELVARGTIAAAWLIGSAAWGGFGARSDLDVVVRGLAPHDLADVLDALVLATGLPVDVLRLEELASPFVERILTDGERLA